MSAKQILSLLYAVGCQYDISDEDMRALCIACGVSFNDLQKSKG